jgi:hypothetical protein
MVDNNLVLMGSYHGTAFDMFGRYYDAQYNFRVKPMFGWTDDIRHILWTTRISFEMEIVMELAQSK